MDAHVRSTELTSHPRSRFRDRVWPYLLVAAVASAIMFARLGQMIIEEHEAYVAVTAAGMADPDNWLNPLVNPAPIPPNTTPNHWMVPIFNGQPRLVKTPLAYWCLAGLLKLGLPLNEYTARVPAAIEAVLLCLLTLALGRRMFAPRTALLGALVLATSVGLIQWGRNARPEMLLAMLCGVTMYCFYVAFHTPRWTRHLWLLAGWVAMGAANLAKEFVPVMLIAPLLMYLAWQQSDKDDRLQPRATFRLGTALLLLLGGVVVYSAMLMLCPPAFWSSIKNLQVIAGAALVVGPIAWYFFAARGYRALPWVLPISIPGAAIMALMFLPWMLHVQNMFPYAENVLGSQVADRAAGAGRWLDTKAPGYYIGSLIGLAAPWVLLLPGAFIVPFLKRFREDAKGLVFLLLWSVLLVLLFSCAVGKRSHYILPMLPALCLLAGYCMDDLFFGHRWLSGKLARLFTVGHAVGALAGVAIIALGYMMISDGQGKLAAMFANANITPEKVLHYLHVGLAAAVPLALAAWAILTTRPRLAVGLLVAGVTAALVVFVSGQHVLDSNGSLREIAVAAREKVASQPGSRLISWDKPNERVVYYYGENIPAANAVRRTFITNEISTLPFTEADKVALDRAEARGIRKWQEWLHNPDHPVVLVERPEKQAQLDKILSRGFTPISPIPVADKKGNFPDRMPMLFLLTGKDATTPPPPPETPSEPE